MDMRNVAVGVVMEVILTTMAPQAQEDEKASLTLVHGNTAVVLDCPHTSNLETGSALDVSNQPRLMTVDSGHTFLVSSCERPMSRGIGARVGTAIAA